MAESIIKGGYEKIVIVQGKVVATRRNGIVTVAFEEAQNTSTSSRTYFGTLPAGWRPEQIVYGAQISGNVGYVDVDHNGLVEAYRPTIGRVDGAVTYVATR